MMLEWCRNLKLVVYLLAMIHHHPIKNIITQINPFFHYGLEHMASPPFTKFCCVDTIAEFKWWWKWIPITQHIVSTCCKSEYSAIVGRYSLFLPIHHHKFRRIIFPIVEPILHIIEATFPKITHAVEIQKFSSTWKSAVNDDCYPMANTNVNGNQVD